MHVCENCKNYQSEIDDYASTLSEAEDKIQKLETDIENLGYQLRGIHDMLTDAEDHSIDVQQLIKAAMKEC